MKDLLIGSLVGTVISTAVIATAIYVLWQIDKRSLDRTLSDLRHLT